MYEIFLFVAAILIALVAYKIGTTDFFRVPRATGMRPRNTRTRGGGHDDHSTIATSRLPMVERRFR